MKRLLIGILTALMVSSSFGCPIYGKNNLRHNGKTYRISPYKALVPQSDSLYRKGVQYKAKWEIRNDSLFLVSFKLHHAAERDTAEYPRFVNWYTGKISYTVSKDNIDGFLTRQESRHIVITNGIASDINEESCFLSSGSLYHAAQQAYIEGKYELAFYLFAQIFYEYPDFFKNDWICLYLITIQDLLGIESDLFRDEYQKSFTRSPSLDIRRAQELLQVYSEPQDSAACSLPAVQDTTIQKLLRWSAQGFIDAQECRVYLQKKLKKDLFKAYPRSDELYEKLQSQNRVTITSKDIPYLVLILGMPRTYLEFLVPYIYPVTIDKETASKISSKDLSKMWRIPCDEELFRIFHYRDSLIDTLMKQSGRSISY